MGSRHRTPGGKLRARGLGIHFDGEPGEPGEHCAITDVAGVEVGYSTLIRGEGPLRRGEGPVRTGVTAILPRGRAKVATPVFAGSFSLNGNGEFTGLHWVEESGLARTGTVSHHGSGDLFLAFSTANAEALSESYPKSSAAFLANHMLDPLFTCVVEATEEAVIDAMMANETMTGRDGVTAMALPHDRLMELYDIHGGPRHS